MSLRPEPIRGEPLRYYVHSETVGDETHVVDLTENDGNGNCSCTDFAMRRQPMLRQTGTIVQFERGRDGKIVSNTTECKHISAAKHHLATSVAKEACLPKRAAPVTIKQSADGLPF